jgi:hypothetical protein
MKQAWCLAQALKGGPLLLCGPQLAAPALQALLGAAQHVGSSQQRSEEVASFSGRSLDSKHSMGVNCPTQWATASTLETIHSLALLRAMMPNRRPLTPLFSATGVQLSPSIPAVAAAGSVLMDLDLDCPGQPHFSGGGLQAIGIKTWRRLKMKKHKIRKRRKANRHSSKS